MYAESTMTARPKMFTMRMSAEEWERVQALADHYGLSGASLFRFMLKREEARLESMTVSEAGFRQFNADQKQAVAAIAETDATATNLKAVRGTPAKARASTKGKK